MKTSGTRLALTTALPLIAALSAAPAMAAEGEIYGPFPVTVKGYTGDKTNSVSYSGQAARNALHDSLKKLAAKGDAAMMLQYYDSTDAGRAVIAPASKGDFKVKQTAIDEISTGKNLAGNTFKGAVIGMPNAMTGPELVAFWIDKAAASENGFDAANGYDYVQLISKFIMGAVNYNQAVDKYLDEYMAADKKPNDAPYKEGAYYTGKEHAWDEAFGYFGAPAHAMTLTPKEVYSIAKMGGEDQAAGLALADHNGDGVVDLKTEMTFGPAYYAAGFDASVYDSGDGTTYLHSIVGAFLEGRKLLASAKGEKLTDAQRAELAGHIATINDNWEAVLAEATFKYAGSVYKDMEKLQIILESGGDTTKAFRAYVKHWGELKGFSLALQTGKKNLGETATRINRLIGFGPVLLNASQVVDIDRDGVYVRDQAQEWGEYMLHLAKLQTLLVEEFGVKAKNNAIGGDLAALAKSLGTGASAEND